MKLQRVLYASFIIYGLLIVGLIFLSLWGHNFLVFDLDEKHQLFYVSVLAVLGVLTTLYWFVVFFVYKK